MMFNARRARFEDLPGLLNLFSASEVSPAAEPRERADRIWKETIDSDHTIVFVAGSLAEIAATCTLITAPNLLRQGRRHGFLENVVTYPALRGRGLGRMVISAALDHAWSANCHHVLMQSGRPDPQVHRFYESLGFQPGLRIGYVAMRP
jgi:GNAT superfamily N-acetyltransferase